MPVEHLVLHDAEERLHDRVVQPLAAHPPEQEAPIADVPLQSDLLDAGDGRERLAFVGETDAHEFKVLIVFRHEKAPFP